ncbi:class I SAM-dependent methyltransferase [Microtetraspora malaysiensis]|uniref:class I SAM-dependent methyltransferase n=1 Tax=Microtetraspora malaysiensis TaxID=161358 RepID=UPI00082E22BD|nr:class I SAM-dependent methyltransferase [Microtetraspora malaysiensis]
MSLDERAARWQADLESWAIPGEILAKAPVSPWTHRVARFARRTDTLLAAPQGPTYERAREALPDEGSVLDVGAGTGAASLPLRPAALVAVDENRAMLEALAARGRESGCGTIRLVEGRWPDVAERTPVADVAVCAHVVFNVPDLVPFLAGLDAHARRRVVLELPRVHPMTWLNPLWVRFHGLTRPDRPTSEDVLAVAREMGFAAESEAHTALDAPFESIEEMASAACLRLCLDPGRAPEVARAAEELGVWPLPPRHFVTIWWDSSK